MPLDDADRAILLLEEWYVGHCNGEWEHQLGLTVQSTDNPGWLITFDELILDSNRLADAIGTYLKDYKVQVSTDGKMVRVFAKDLKNGLLVAGDLVALSNN